MVAPGAVGCKPVLGRDGFSVSSPAADDNPFGSSTGGNTRAQHFKVPSHHRYRRRAKLRAQSVGCRQHKREQLRRLGLPTPRVSSKTTKAVVQLTIGR